PGRSGALRPCSSSLAPGRGTPYGRPSKAAVRLWDTRTAPHLDALRGCQAVDLWLPEHDARHALGALPDGVSCRTYPLRGDPPEAILDTEFLVAVSRTRWLRGLLPRMERLRVLHTVSAGVDWLLPLVPPGVQVCSARGTRDGA